jgi:hypothetical protein
MTGIYFVGQENLSCQVSSGFLMIFFSGGFFHRNPLLEPIRKFLFLAMFTGFFHRRQEFL